MREQCYSADGEYYHSDMCSAICDKEAGDVTYIGEAVKPCASEFVPDVDWILEDMSERAYDCIGEAAEDWPDVSQDAKDELEAFLNDWAVRNCQVNFYKVVNEREYVLTAEDVA